MESSDKTFHGTIPLEILDEFFYLVAKEEGLKEMSLMCPRWRYLSQRELFAVVQVDPMLICTQGIYQVATPPHAHLATYVKGVRVVNLSGTTAPRDPKHAFPCPPQFTDFLRSLPALQTMDFRYSHLDWAGIAEDTVNAFLGIFSRPSFRVLEVSGGKNFPLPLFLHRTNVGTLVMMDTKDLALPSPTERTGLIGTQLTGLSLFDADTIRAFLAFFRINPTLAQAFQQNLTQLTLEYVECGLFSSFRSDSVMELLTTVGTSVESLKIEASWPFAEPTRSLNLRALTNLRHLHLGFTVPIPQKKNVFLTNHILPIITSLPMPQNLITSSIILNYCIQSIPTTDNCTRQLKILGSLIEPVFMDVKWTNLSRMCVGLQLLGVANAPIQTRPQKNILPRLKSRNVRIEAFIGT